jgi:hypothetical protein
LVFRQKIISKITGKKSETEKNGSAATNSLKSYSQKLLLKSYSQKFPNYRTKRTAFPTILRQGAKKRYYFSVYKTRFSEKYLLVLITFGQNKLGLTDEWLQAF